jgi:hypothetical protein
MWFNQAIVLTFVTIYSTDAILTASAFGVGTEKLKRR